MKLFKKFPVVLFKYLPAWNRFSVPAREAMLDCSLIMNLVSSGIAKSILSEFVKSGWLETSRRRPRQALCPFLHAMRILAQHPLFDSPDQHRLAAYFSDHLLQNETPIFFGEFMARHLGMQQEVANVAAGEEWLDAFLQASSAAPWPKEHGPLPDERERAQWTEETMRCAREFCLRLKDGPNPVPLCELSPQVESNRNLWSGTLLFGIRHGLFFMDLNAATFEPQIGLWPGVHSRLNTPKVEPPAPTPPPDGATVFSSPHLVNDMLALLVGAGDDGIRLSRHGGFFKCAADELQTALASIPDYLPAKSTYRLSTALNWLTALKFAHNSGFGSPDRRFRITPDGEKWLAMDGPSRVQRIHDELIRRKNPGHAGYDWSHPLTWHPYRVVHLDPTLSEALSSDIQTAYASLPEGEWYSLDAFLKWQVASNNPLKERTKQNRYRMSYEYGPIADSRHDEQWTIVLRDFLTERLIPLGGARVTEDSQGRLLFSLTEAGSYYIGRRSTFAMAETDAGHIIVQPDFEIVFTGSNPAAERELARVAERAGHVAGVLFRLTRASILAARHRDMNKESILEILAKASCKPLPSNVRTQVADWSDAYRRVTCRHPLLLCCPDKATAACVAAKLPGAAAFLSDTLLEVTGRINIEALRKRLDRDGIGLASEPLGAFEQMLYRAKP